MYVIQSFSAQKLIKHLNIFNQQVALVGKPNNLGRQQRDAISVQKKCACKVSQLLSLVMNTDEIDVVYCCNTIYSWA